MNQIENRLILVANTIVGEIRNFIENSQYSEYLKSIKTDEYFELYIQSIKGPEDIKEYTTSQYVILGCDIFISTLNDTINRYIEAQDNKNNNDIDDKFDIETCVYTFQNENMSVIADPFIEKGILPYSANPTHWCDLDDDAPQEYQWWGNEETFEQWCSHEE